MDRMSAKFLHSIADENPEFNRQIGCMTGIFQMFDRQHLVTGRRLSGQNYKRITSGHALPTTSNSGADHSSCPPHVLLEKNLSKSLNENRVSMESTRSSFSSSSCSSFSSLDGNKSTQQETPSLGHSSYSERSTTTPAKPKNYDFDSETADAKIRSNPAYSSLQSSRQSLDLRDVVKDSIYKDNYDLSVKTTLKDELKNRTLNLKDSPRPLLSSSTADKQKPNIHNDLSESLQVLLKFKEATWNLSERNESQRKPYEAKDSPFVPVSKDAPRLSYDGQGVDPSLYSRDGSKLSSKLRELPRLSLDSREGSLRSSGVNSRTHSKLNDLQRSKSTRTATIVADDQNDRGSYKRPPSVVAKLMGLEAMPNLNQDKLGLADTHLEETTDTSNKNQALNKSITTHENEQDKLPSSSKSFTKGHVTGVKNSEPPLKPLSHIRLPIEPAPWKQREKIRLPQKMAFKYRDSHVKQQPESVYSEIEKRLKDLEFQQSNNDLRALKQILDAMHTKGLLEAKKGEERPSEESVYAVAPKIAQNLKPVNYGNTQLKGRTSAGGYESPIVIMKPASSINRSSTSSIIPLAGLANLQRLRTNNPSEDKTNASINTRISRDQSSKVTSTNPINRLPLLTDKKVRKDDNGMQKTRTRISERSSRPHSLSKDSDGIPAKASNSLSPRILQQKRMEAEKKVRASIPSPELNKSPRPLADRHSSETISPRLRRKQAQPQQNEDRQRDVSSGFRSLTSRTESSIIVLSKVDDEVTSANRSPVLNGPGIAADITSSASKQEENSDVFIDENSATELPTAVHEQPSPISVLDASLHQNNMPSAKKYLNSNKNDGSSNTPDRCSPIDMAGSRASKLNSGINQQKLSNIENLVQKLRELSSHDDETVATDHIASLCGTQSPDHRYASEILLASGLLMKDFTSVSLGLMQIQLHSSGYLINPDLFLVLEQTKSGLFAKPEAINESTQRPKSDPEKLRRKLVFNVVNELLSQKLENGVSSSYPILAKNTRFPSGQHLLKELCSDIEKLKTENLAAGKCEEGSNLMSGEDMLRQYGEWNNFDKELPGIILEIERSIFKELIDDVVNTERALCPKVKSLRRRRQLFAK